MHKSSYNKDRFSDNKLLKDVIYDLLEAYKIKDKINDVNILGKWEKIVGKLVAMHTENIYIKQKTLYIKLDSPALRNDLMYSKNAIIRGINREMKSELIDNIVIM